MLGYQIKDIHYHLSGRHSTDRARLTTLGLLTLLTSVESRVKHKVFFLVKLYPLIALYGFKDTLLKNAGRGARRTAPSLFSRRDYAQYEFIQK